MQNSLTDILSRHRIIPVATLESPDIALPLAALLRENGLPILEITFRTGAAGESIRRIRQRYPDMVIGAGTVLNPDMAGTARDAGADFMVAPGFNPGTVDFCLENHIPIIPGIDSPSLIEAAMDKGIFLVKFYPAEASGGIPYIRAVAGPYQKVRLMPTGGINPDNLPSYLAYEKVVACGASWIVPASALAAGDLDRVLERVQAMLSVLQAGDPHP